MSIHVPQNFYRQTITRAVTLTGATNIYVSALPTPAEGYITISPASATLREIIYYTAKGTDGNGYYITVTLANRGLGGTTAQTHIIGEPVRMNVGAETIQEVSDAIDQIVAGGAQNASTTVKGISKLSVAPASATNPIAVGDNDPRIISRPAEIKFGGTGADGALTITSGATNIDLASAQVVVKNYTSISITGTGSLTFTNPHANGTAIVLKSQGNVTLTSSATPMIDASGMGGSTSVGDGSPGYSFSILKSNNGVSPVAYNVPGVGGSIATINPDNFVKNILSSKFPFAICGAGGSGNSGKTSGGGGGGSIISAGTSGATGSNTFGDNFNGGRGGGALIIECDGSLNFTTSSGISVAGKNGVTATSGVSGGGGGGGGGTCHIFYRTLTANSGTITVSGGTGGSPSSSGGVGGNGGTGFSLVALNTEFA